MVKIGETEEDLNVAMTRRFGLFLYGPDFLRLHPNAVRRNDKPYKANALHVKLAFR